MSGAGSHLHKGLNGGSDSVSGTPATEVTCPGRVKSAEEVRRSKPGDNIIIEVLNKPKILGASVKSRWLFLPIHSKGGEATAELTRCFPSPEARNSSLLVTLHPVCPDSFPTALAPGDTTPTLAKGPPVQALSQHPQRSSSEQTR